MTDRTTIPADPTLEMCIAYMIASGFSKSYVRQWTDYLERNLGTSNECSFVPGIRAAIAVGSRRVKLDQITRGYGTDKTAKPRPIRKAKKTLILAGNKAQFDHWVVEHRKTTSDLVFGDLLDDLTGVEFGDIIVTGTFWDRPDARQLHDFAKTRVR